jgi:3-oxoacyl-[acyl-carrier-protein] synthase-3
MHANPGAGQMLRDSSLASVREVCGEAARRAGVSLRDIDFLVCNTPTAWYAEFCARMLELDPSRTIDTHAQYANIGPALLVANLWHAAEARRIRPGDLVLVFSIGSSSNATAAVIRWTSVAIAPFVDA